MEGEMIIMLAIPVGIVGGWFIYNYIQDRVDKRKRL